MSRKMLLVLLSFLVVLAGCTAVVGIIAEEGIKQRHRN
ncbi:putative lipoprotein [Thermotoga neapolitana DSM 4359]|uniref:Lipoprotein n=2 Tax=Thermotoga TaxID=2335 RepID=Q9X089_THEMA|nr:hypothetical protein TM_0994 [Thermotoga maritima MSB8]AJG41641.1 hypothetical protein TRQ7_09332 [Thermotoga sp. RQ7]AKE26906.1 hypothetical protein THMC_1016 [Thermotoga maritima]KFZ21368.1 hypothetical protein LA10_08374 [Thermotoga neapolitana LA10]AGL49923.1 hypothetical protein Tmari_0998 [Thermotoga maritima MSB8]